VTRDKGPNLGRWLERKTAVVAATTSRLGGPCKVSAAQNLRAAHAQGRRTWIRSPLLYSVPCAVTENKVSQTP